MRFSWFPSLCLAVSLSPVAFAQSAPDIYAITNAKIVVGNGKTIEKGTIVLRSGLIVAVGDKVDVPADATVIDGAQTTLYPGLIDGFSHLGMPAPADYTAARGDSYRIAKVRADNTAPALFKAEDNVLEGRRKQGFGAALVAPSVGMISGSSAVFSLSTSSNPAEQVIAAPVAMHIDWTAPDVGYSYPASLMGKIAATRQALYDAQNAATLLEAYAKNPEGRPRPVVARPIAALVPVVQGHLPVIFHADSVANIRRVIKLCREFKLRPIIDGGLEAYEIADELKADNVAVLLTLNLPQPPRAPRRGEDAGNDPNNTLQQLRYRASVPKTAAALAKVGVPFAFTLSGLDAPASYNKNVRRLIAAGLSEEKAVAALTVEPAKLLGVERQLGTLEKGKIANVLAITNGSLFDGKGKLKYVFVDGKQVEIDVEKPSAPQVAAKPPVNIPLPPGVSREQALDTLKNQPDIARPFLPAGVTVEMAIAALEGTGGGAAPAEPKKEDDTTVAAPPEVGAGPIPPLPPAVPNTYVLRGATVWTSASAGILQNADVYVKEGKIAKVGSDLKVPGGTLEIPAQGKHITPGLIDCHSHTAIDGGVNEGTNSITAECRIEDVIDSEDINIYRELAGGTTAANMLHGSANAIGGQNAVIKWRWGKTPDEMLLKGAWPGIKFALGENPKQSNFRGGGRDRRYPGSRLGVEKVIRDAFQHAKDYRAALVAYRAGKIPLPPPRDLQAETILELLEGKRVVHSHSYRQDEILMLLRLAQEYGVKIATFQHVLEGYKVANELAKAGVGGSTFSDWWGYKIEAYDAIPYNAALMAQKGVVVSFNSDSDELARRLNLEAAKGVRYGGMSPVEALKAVTINPAKQLGVDRMVGSLEEGKDADLVVWSGDPLSTQSVCEKTFVDGQLCFDRAADIAARPTLEAEKKRLIAAERPERKGEGRPGAPPSAPPSPAPEAAPAPVVAPAANTTPTTGVVTAIVGATVHPISAPDIPNGVVLVQGEKILAVGTADAITVPTNAVVHHAEGQHVYPGLIDLQTTLGLVEIDSIASTDDSEEMGDFNPEIHTEIAINPDSERIGVVRQAGILTVGVVPKGGIISGTGALVNTDGWTWEDMTIDPNAGLYINFPTLGFRRFSGNGHHGDDISEEYLSDGLRATGAVQPPGGPFPPGGPRGGRRGEDAEDDNPQLKALDKFLADARRYKTARSANEKNVPPLAVDAKFEAMIPVLDGKIPVFIRADREQDIRRAVEWAKKNGFRLTLVGGQEADKCADLLAKANIPLIFGPVLNLPRREDLPYDDMYTLPKVLTQAGIKVALTTGLDNTGEETRRLAHHAAMAAAFGMPTTEAVKSITLYPAQLLGVADRLGSLAPGKDATLIVTTGNILEITSDVKAAWIRGRSTSLTNKQTRLYEKYKARP